MEQDFPKVVPVFPGDTPPEPPAELPDAEIQLIHAGLMIPTLKAVRSMAREIRKWRGEPNPDLV
jgi:hypothetical protein